MSKNSSFYFEIVKKNVTKLEALKGKKPMNE